MVQGEENEASILHFLCDLCLHFEPRSTESSTTTTSCSTPQCFIISLEQASSKVLKRSTTAKDRKTAAESHVVTALRKRLDSELQRLKQKMDDFHCLWASLVCLQHIRYCVSHVTSM